VVPSGVFCCCRLVFFSLNQFSLFTHLFDILPFKFSSTVMVCMSMSAINICEKLNLHIVNKDGREQFTALVKNQMVKRQKLNKGTY